MLPRILPMHAVVALALPAVEAFDLAIPAQVFADPGLPRRYEFTVCAPQAGLVPSTAGFAVQAEHGLEALAAADTVVVPGYLPLDDPGERVCSALRQAAARGARAVRQPARRPAPGGESRSGRAVGGRGGGPPSRSSLPAAAWAPLPTCGCTWPATPDHPHRLPGRVPGAPVRSSRGRILTTLGSPATGIRTVRG